MPAVPRTVAEGPFWLGPAAGVTAAAVGVATSTQLSAELIAVSPLALLTTSLWFSPLFWPRIPPNVTSTVFGMLVRLVKRSTKRALLAPVANVSSRPTSIPDRFTGVVVANVSTPSKRSPKPRSSSPSMRAAGAPETLTRMPP